jgi:hypothetical protein
VGCGDGGVTTGNLQKFFVSFFQKRSAFRAAARGNFVVR